MMKTEKLKEFLCPFNSLISLKPLMKLLKTNVAEEFLPFSLLSYSNQDLLPDKPSNA